MMFGKDFGRNFGESLAVEGLDIKENEGMEIGVSGRFDSIRRMPPKRQRHRNV